MDSDADGIPDSLDRCAAFADSAQSDGNADGVVGAGDVVRLMRFAVGLETPDAREFAVLDSSLTPRWRASARWRRDPGSRRDDMIAFMMIAAR